MKNIILGIFVGLALGGFGTWFYLKHHEEHEPEKKEEKKEESRIQHGTNGETFIKLDKEAQEHCGLKMAALEAIESKPEVKAFGRVLDPSLLATQLVDINTAKAALEASRKEHERLKALHAQNQNVSTRSVEAAEAAVKRDEIIVEAAQAKLRLAWGKSLAERKDLSAFIESLVSFHTAIVRVDLPIGEAMSTMPSAARIGPITAEGNLIESKFLGAATSADPQVQGQGFLFLAETNSLLPSAAVTAYLTVSGKPKTGVLVPSSALVRFEGEVFIYVQKQEDKFEREEVKLDVPLKNGWLVAEGLSPGEKIVVTGAQQLLSEELKSRSGEE